MQEWEGVDRLATLVVGREGMGLKFSRIVWQREAGLEGSKLWIAVVGLDDLMDSISEISTRSRDGGTVPQQRRFRLRIRTWKI